MMCETWESVWLCLSSTRHSKFVPEFYFMGVLREGRKGKQKFPIFRVIVCVTSSVRRGRKRSHEKIDFFGTFYEAREVASRWDIEGLKRWFWQQFYSFSKLQVKIFQSKGKNWTKKVVDSFIGSLPVITIVVFAFNALLCWSYQCSIVELEKCQTVIVDHYEPKMEVGKNRVS